MRKLSVGAVLLFATLSAYADVTLNGLFGDHMVFQREIPVAVFGTAAPGETVTVSFAGKEKSATADKDGRWRVKLDAMKASTNSAAMTIAGKNTLKISDIIVGDVWVCSGQSNMEWTLGGCNRPDDIKDADFPLMRQFHVPGRVLSSPVTDTKNGWVVCTPQSAGNFTAVGFYFGRKLHRETGIPIGLLKSAWGGTAIEPWVSSAGLATIPELAKDKANLDTQIKAYVDALAGLNPKIDTYVSEARKALSSNAELPAPVELPSYPISNGGPGGWHCLYNGMISPLTPFGIKGAIWYQGESNGGEGDSYFQKKRALIGGWRKAWNQGDFPFYFVQLANFQNPNNDPAGGDGWAKLRMAQNKTLTIPNTGMAVAIDLADVGNPGDIHPKNKLDVGERLALWSLAKDYGKKNLVYSGPLYKEMKSEGDKIRLVFDSVGSGLTVATKKGYDPMVKDPQGKLQKFAIAGEDKKWVWANAVIDGATVVVSSPEVSKPVAVRYAFSMNPDGCNLYNNEGLPAAPFRTDEW
ncbi:MAG: sialate O-acetylesterase [bacterium]